jgi:hypothetical protein
VSEAPDLQARVRAFHEQFGFYVGTDPMVPPPDQIRYERAGLIAEEAGELVVELTRGLPPHLIVMIEERFRAKIGEAFSSEEPYDPLKVMREAADVHVGILGAGVNGAFNLDQATAVVCESNLTRSGPDDRGMAFKGEGFVPPDMRRVLQPARRWWHAFGAEVAGLGWVQLMAGPGSSEPGDVRENSIPFEGAALSYLTSWDHEPSEREKESVQPEQYRELDPEEEGETCAR